VSGAGKRASQGGYLLAKAQQVSSRVFNRLLKEAGGVEVNSAQGRILFALWKKGGMSIAALSKETALEPSTLTSMLDRLEAGGLLRRSPSPGDRRAFVVECTDEGMAMESRYAALSARMTDIFYEGMSVAEISAFEKSLGAILENLEEAEAELKG
jgi:MarR family transcriptional regulator, organic hydroperoxide resistance regulator